MTLEQLQAALADANAKLETLTSDKKALTASLDELTTANNTLLKTNNQLLTNQVMGMQGSTKKEKPEKYGIDEFINEFSGKEEK